jgi:hypothetical protein
VGKPGALLLRPHPEHPTILMGAKGTAMNAYKQFTFVFIFKKCFLNKATSVKNATVIIEGNLPQIAIHPTVPWHRESRKRHQFCGQHHLANGQIPSICHIWLKR